jgi:hypothetical protein
MARFWIPKKLRDKEAYEEALKLIDDDVSLT